MNKKYPQGSEESEFKGNVVLCLNPEVDNPKTRFNFGLSKAKLILSKVDDIKQFVKNNE